MTGIRTLTIGYVVLGLAAVAALSPQLAQAQRGDQAPPADAQGAGSSRGAASDQGNVGDQAAQAQNASGSQGDELQEVVVTAERRAENVQTTPISIQAMSDAQLASQDITHVKNLQLYTPSLTVLDDGLYQAPSIRGIGNSAIIPNVTTGVAFIEDGLFSPEPHGLDDPFYDMADTEVLRGPQGTFVGYSSTGGAIETTSANPNFRGTSGYVELNVGNFTDKRADGAFNFALSDTFAVRFAFNEEQMGSFYRDDGALVVPGEAEPIQDPGSTDNKDFRLSLLWKPTDHFQALGKFQYSSSNDGGDPSQVNQKTYTVPAGTACPYGSGAVLPGPDGGSTCHTTDYVYSSHSPYVLNWLPQTYLLPQLGHPYYNYRLGLHLDYTFDNGIALRSITGFQQSQYDTYGNTNGIPTTLTAASGLTNTFDYEGAAYQWIPKDDYTSEEFDVISPTTGPFWDKVNWIGGATWFYRDTGIGGYSVSGTPPNYSLETPDVTGTNEDDLNRIVGLFGQVSWQMTRTLQWQIGARENWDNNPTRATIDETAIPGLIPATEPDVGCSPNLPYMTGIKFLPSATGYKCTPPVDQNTQFQDKTPTGKVDLNWTPLPGQFFYAFFARGYKAGGAQPGAPNFQPEHVNDWELGWKGTYGNWLTASLGGYHMTYQGMQQDLTTVDTLTGGGEVINIGTSTLEGIESTLNARVGGLGINFSGDYEHTKMGAAPGVVATYTLPSTARGGECGLPGVPASPCFDYYPYSVTISGEQDVFAPKLSATLGVDYRFNVLGGVLDPRITYSYTAAQYASFFQIPFYELGPRHIWNAAITYDVNQWDTELYVNNFTNEVYLTGASPVYYGAPEQMGIRVRRDF